MTLNLKAQKRDQGQSAKQIRKNGFIPCSMYGKSVEATHIQIPHQSIHKCIKEGARKVNINFEGKTYFASIEEAQKGPVGNQVLHVSFHAFNQDEKISLEIPVHLEGKAKGQLDGGVLQQHSHTVFVYGPANDLPESLSVDVSELEQGSSLHVSDLHVSSKFEIKENDDKVLVSCNYPKLQPLEDEKPEVVVEENPESEVEEPQNDKQAA